MNICFIGDHSSNLDEGLKNIAYYISKELSKDNDTCFLNIKKPFTIKFIRILLTFNPDVIHYFTGPTILSFVLLKILGIRWKKSRQIVSALHPSSVASLFSNKLFLKTSKFLRPMMVLVQDQESKDLFDSINYVTRLIFNGVDTEKFAPIDKQSKFNLRKTYNISVKKFVLLHVGHLSTNRNLQILKELQTGDQQVLIAASTYLENDEELYKSLVNKGCIVFRGYCKDVNELYELSDCYIFPVKKGKSIFMPLSVMEAMSCNLPVISTKFEGLISAFEEGEGLFFEDDITEYNQIISRIKSGSEDIATRKQVLRYSWKNISQELMSCYSSL